MKKIIVAVMVLVLSLSFMNLTAMADININWEKETDKPTASEYSAVGVVGSKIYVIGGRIQDRNTSINNVEIYDTIAKTWTLGAPMPSARHGASCAIIDGKIYVIGGISNSKIHDEVEIYDVATNTWSIGAKKPTASFGSVSLVVNGKIYTLGGTNNLAAPFEIYDPVSNSWTKEAPIPQAKRYSESVIYNGKIYLFGGTESIGNSATNDVDIYDIKTKQWTKGTPIPYSVSYGSAKVIDGTVYYMGGQDNTDNKPTYDSIVIYDIDKNEWNMSTSILPGGPISGFSSAIVNGRLYIIGGYNGESLNTVYSFAIDEKLFVYLNTGEELQLSMDYNLSENANYTWSSSDQSVATVDINGKVTAVAEGTTYVYCESSDGMFRDYVPVKVSKDASEKRLAVHLTADESKRLWITDDTSAVTWFSNDTSVAVVDANGNVTGVSKGLCLVQGTINNKTYNIYVRVL